MHKRFIHIDFTPTEIDEDYDVDVEVVADIADAPWQINERLITDHDGRLQLFDITELQTLRYRICEDLQAENASPMKPQRILADARAILGADDVLMSNVGAHKMWISRYYQCDEADTYLISNGFCSTGFALPEAIGVKIAVPERRSLPRCGDANFLMNMQDRLCTWLR